MNRELDPAELQASEAALRRSRALQRALLEASLDGIVAIDGHGRVLQLNGVAEQMFGWMREEALGQDIAELVVPPEYRDAHRRGLASVVATGESARLGRRLEFPALRKDGSRFDVELTVVRVPDQEPALFVATLRDVTERKAAERALREMNERLGMVARATNDAVWDWDLDRDTVWWNAAYEELFGHPVEPGVSATESWINHIHPEDRERVSAEIEAVQRGSAQTWSGEYRFRRRAGGYADVYDRGFVVRDASGRAVRMIGAMMDLSELKARERALRESEDRFRSLLALSSDWYWETDAEHRFLHTPSRATQLTGYRAPHYVGRARWEVEGLSPVSGDWAAHREVLARRESFRDFELVQVRADGGSTFLQVSGEPVFDADGAFTGYRGTAKNITAAKEREAALRESEARFRSVAELSSDWYWEQDAELRFTRIDGRGAQASAGSGDAAGYCGMRRWDLPDTEPAEGDWSRHIAALERREPFRHLLVRRRMRDGGTRLLSISGEPVFDDAGAFTGYRGTGADVTDLHRAQEELRRFRLAMDNTGDLVAIIDSESLTYVDVNVTTCKVLGFAREDLIGKPVQNRTLSRHDLRRMYDEVIASPGRAGTFRGHFTRKDGSRMPVEARRHAFQSDGRWLIASIARDTTERDAAEQALRQQDAFFRALIENASDAISACDLDWRFVYVSPALCRHLGLPAEALRGRLFGGTSVIDAQGLRERLGRVLRKDGDRTETRFSSRRADGELRVHEAVVSRTTGPSGEQIYVTVSRDITDRISAEAEARRKDAYFRAVIEHSGDAIAVYDRDMRLRYRSPSAARLSGFSDEERIGGAMKDVILEEDLPGVQRALEEVVREPGRAAQYRCRVKQKGGNVLHVEGTATNMFHDPAVNGLVLNYRDVSDRVRAEDALKRFRLALDRSGELIALVDLETMLYVDVNEALCAALGYSRDEMLRMRPDELIPIPREELRETYRRLTQGEEPPAFRSYYRCKDGSRFPYESRRHAVLSDGRWLIVSIARDIRRELAAEEALRKREEEFRAVAENAPDGIMRFGADLRCLYANSAIEKTAGLPRAELVGRALAQLPISAETRDALETGVRRALETGETQAVDFSYQGPRGERHYHARLAPERSAEGVPVTVLGISSDVTAQRVAERAMAESEARLRSIVYASAEPLLLVDSADGRTLFANPAAGALFGRGPGALEGTHLGLPLAAGRPAEVDIVLPEGGVRPAEMQFAATEMDGREVLVVSLHDLSERKRFEEHIRHLATHDGLTGLPNRAVLGDRVAQAIAAARRSGGALALLFVDLDQFKLVNDSFGHAAGDTLLNEVATRLRGAVRDGDTVARLGGDEFVILLTGLARAGDSALVARKIAEVLDRPVMLDTGELRVTASIGISLFPDDGQDLDALLQCADAAMYRAKDLGRNAFHYYSAEMGEQARVRVETEAGLRRALERDELRLHFQPQIDFKTGAVAAVEALLRWEHPERGMISPAAFIPVAEESGLIVPIGQWALRAACREAAGWNAAGLGPVKVCVNLSARQFWRGSVTEAVRAALADSGLPASQLELEITESVVARDLNQVMLSLEQLRRMGVSIAIDDFGTGYSSLAYLRSLPIHQLKIDKSFIRGIPVDAEATALVGEIVRLAHVLSLRVVAEGVETPEQARYLREAGCEAMQGFLFARPLPPNELAALLRSGRRFTLETTPQP